MAEATKVTLGILGIMTILGTGIFFLTPDQIDRAYTCTSNNATGIFESFSKTNITAYWTIDGVKKQSVCTKGTWIPTREWMKQYNLVDENITLDEAINESVLTEEGAKIIITGETINVDKAMQISIKGETYNISYTPTIKCICEKSTGCQFAECLQ